MKQFTLYLSLYIFSLFFFQVIIPKSEISNQETETPGVPSDDWFEVQRAFPFKEIPNEERLKSIEYVRNNMQRGDFNENAVWSLAGPTNIEGRITTIEVHPTNPQIVYIGAANGGIWKSTNFCQTWTSVFDNQNTSSIGSIAIDPANPNIMYAGTGESNSSRSTYPGTGMFKTTDAGNSWSSVGLDSSFCIGNIAINPLNTQEVYVAVMGYLRRKNQQRGVYKTINGGSTWTRSLFVADSVGAIDVVLNSSTPSQVYAAMWERTRREDYIKYGGPMTALYRTTNSGVSWNVLTGGFPSNDPTLGRIALGMSNSNPLIIYALTAYANGNSRGLYKTTDGGNSWSLINSSVASSSNYAWYNRPCRVDPSNPNIVYCGGLNMDRSVNGGTSFGSVGASHVDQHAVGFAASNPNFVAIGNDGGIDYSTNGGTSWLASNSLPITQFYAGEIDHNNPATLLGGTQDNGTPRTLNGMLNNWVDIYGGDGFYCLVDYTTSQLVYASSQNGGLGRSTNGGSSWLGATSGLDLAYTNWMTPYVMDKNTPLTLYCGTYRIHRTVNGMQSWTPISPDLATGHVQNLGTVTTVDAAKSNPNVIYCGTDDANVWVTTNGGTNWTLINSGLPRRWVTRVTSHPDSANVCYVTVSGYKVDSLGSHIYRTTNYGSTWTSIGGNLPNAPINDVIIDPADYRTLYIGTDIAVMYTTNLGSTWQILGTGFPTNVPCHDLTFHAPTRTLVVWTHGRSAFKIILPLVGIQPTGTKIPQAFKLYQNYPNPFNPSTKIKFDLPSSHLYERGAGGFVTLIIYDILGREVASIINQPLKPGTYEVDWNASYYSSGIYFYKLTAGGHTDTKKLVLEK